MAKAAEHGCARRSGQADCMPAASPWNGLDSARERRAARLQPGTVAGFETLTLCPIDTRALEPDLLDAGERAWLDAYHADVRAALAPRLEGADPAWLEARCAPLAG